MLKQHLASRRADIAGPFLKTAPHRTLSTNINLFDLESPRAPTATEVIGPGHLVVVRHIHELLCQIDFLPAVVSDSLRASCTSKVTVLIHVYNCGRSGGSARRRLVWVITGLLFQPDRNLRCPLNVPPCRPWFLYRYINILLLQIQFL